jgi:uncharacterized damage-inducible protein DinB
VHAAFDSCYDRLAALHAEIEQALDGLPPEALDWSPGPDMNSLAVLVVHTTGAERYWIGDVAAGVPSGRDRDAEFRTQGVDAAQLRARLAETLDLSRRFLEGLSVEQLEEARVSPRSTRTFTVAWCLAHALEHTGQHAGQIQMTRQLWDQRAGHA